METTIGKQTVWLVLHVLYDDVTIMMLHIRSCEIEPGLTTLRALNTFQSSVLFFGPEIQPHNPLLDVLSLEV